VDNTTAVLAAAGIGVAGGVGGTWLMIRHQSHLAGIERRQTVYVDSLTHIHSFLDLTFILTFDTDAKSRESTRERIEQDRTPSARATIVVHGSARVKALHEKVRLAFLEWKRHSDSFPAGWPQGEPPPPGLDAFREGLAQRWRTLRDAVQQVEEQMNREMTR
jgi:hypothetical protein